MIDSRHVDEGDEDVRNDKQRPRKRRRVDTSERSRHPGSDISTTASSRISGEETNAHPPAKPKVPGRRWKTPYSPSRKHGKKLPLAKSRLQNSQSLRETALLNSAAKATTAAPPPPVPRLQSVRSTSVRSGLAPDSVTRQPSNFWPGRLIWCSHHVTAQDKEADPEHDAGFVQSRNAKICSKFRCAVVLWAYPDGHVFLLPCFTNGGNGLRSIQPENRKFHMPLLRDESPDIDEGILLIKMMSPKRDGAEELHQLSVNTSVSLTEGFTINMNEDVQFAGVLTRRSTERVIRKYEEYKKEAEEESWDNR